MFLIERYLAVDLDIQACSIGEKNELVSYLPGYSHRMVSEILQESLGILIKKNT